MPLTPGVRFDRYTIVELLGAGAMGEVYRAIDTKLERAVALKVLRPEMDLPGSGGDTASAARRMLREARAVAALEHPNVVSIFDVGEIHDEKNGTTTFLAMELIKGKPLRAFVGDMSIPVETRLRWLTDVARALAAAHRAGLVHRDVKPDNVMVREDGVAKVLDFGIVKRTAASVGQGGTETVTREGLVIGTPYYMAPEQMRGHALDGRVDQFAWAVMAYELLTGKRPWSEGDALQLVAEVLSHVPEAPSVREPRVPIAVSRAIERAMEKRPEDRFATMDDLIAALEAKDSLAAPAHAVSPAAKSVGLEHSLPHAITHAEPVLITGAATATPTTIPPTARGSVGPMVPVAIAGALILGSVIAAGLLWRHRASTDAAAASKALAAPHAGCTTNAECTRAKGSPQVCHRDDGACAPLESEDCHVRADKRALEGEDTVWIGAMYPLTGDDAKDYGTSEMNGVDLGRRDFAEILGGVAHARPIGLVTCDDAVNAERAAHHLVDDVRVPAVIGFRSSEEVVRLAPEVFLPKGVLVMSAINASPMITSIPQPPGSPRLVWRTMFNTKQFAKPLAAFVTEVLEPRARKARSTGALRVAFVRAKTLSETALSNELLGTLTFNGKTALANGPNFREIVIDDPYAPNAKPNYEEAITSLLAFGPDIVVFDFGDALATSVFFPLEARLPAGATHPLYACANPMPHDVYPFIGKSAERRKRFFALTNLSSTTANAHLVSHINETFPEKVTRTSVPNSGYDAFYVVAYSALALGEKPVTGAAIAGAIPRLLPPGKSIDVGPLGILDGYGTLSGGANIDLEGAIGHLDFDVASGEAPIDMAVLCVGTDRSGAASEAIESGLVYDARAAKLTGTMECP